MATVLKTKMISTGPIVLREMAHEGGGESEMSNAEPKRVSARAVKRIFDRQSGELVGWLYEWNTGSLVPRWKTEVHKDVVYD